MVLRIINCIALCVAPHFIYYHATELSEYEALTSTGYGAFAAVTTALVKGFLTALYTPAGSDNIFLRVGIAAAIGIADVVGLWYALTKFSHRNISNSHKFQAVGLGWAAACSVMFHLAPIAAGAFSADVPISNVFKACQANVALAHVLSMACAGVLFWSKKAKPAGVLPMLRLLVVAHAVVPAAVSVLEDLHRISTGEALGLHAAMTAVLAAASYQLWQQCNPKAA